MHRHTAIQQYLWDNVSKRNVPSNSTCLTPKHSVHPAPAFPHQKSGPGKLQRSIKNASHSCDPFRDCSRWETLPGKRPTHAQLANQRLQMYVSRTYSSNFIHGYLPDTSVLKLPNVRSPLLCEDQKNVPREAYSKHPLPSIAENPKIAKRVDSPPLDADNFPKTGFFLPMEPPFSHTLLCGSGCEELGPVVLSAKIQDNQRHESERLIGAEYGPGIRRLVFDVFEVSPYYQSNYGYEELLLYNNECFPIDSSFAAYSQACSGKGAPMKSYPGKSRYHEGPMKPFYKLQSPSDNTLIFESRFESGNLRRAIQVGEYEYDLFMKTDFGTSGYSQWFFFRVSNLRKGQTYKFNIMNMMKPDCLYNQGMKILVHPIRSPSEKGDTGWKREGTNIAYYKNCVQKRVGAYYYTLTFTITASSEAMYVASDYPYTYSDLMRLLKEKCNEKSRDKVRMTTLCKTLAGNQCPLLIVTNFNSTPEEIAKRPAIIFTARVHPGETNGSLVMEGIVKFLTGNSFEASQLRALYVFKIVPMLNPDGVIIGNYRCSLAGQDLNRQWRDPTKHLFPEIYAVKDMIRKTLESRRIALFCDFHGHSRKKDIFIYGCNAAAEEDRLKERIFPLLLSKNTSFFNYQNCFFEVQRPRESTARVVICREFGIISSYTCEASFCGPSAGKFAGFHFTPAAYHEFAGKFCETLLDALEPVKVESAVKELKELHPAILKNGTEGVIKVESDSADDENNPGVEKAKKAKKKGKKKGNEVSKKRTRFNKIHRKGNHHTNYLIYYDKFTVVAAGENGEAN